MLLGTTLTPRQRANAMRTSGGSRGFPLATRAIKMGIPGLKTFVQNNVRLKKVTSVDFKGVVVDGKSLIYYINGFYRISCLFGGQYPELARVLQDFFEALRSNRIRVVVVFDGIDYEDQKHETKLKRKKGSYSDVRRALRENKAPNLLPPLAVLVFCQVLRKLEIPFIFVDGDADQKIAQIANFYHFPVLADDSDYFIFDLSAGYMPLHTFEWAGNIVSALLYERGSLVASAGFQSRELVLGIPLLIGNDFYEAIISKSLGHSLLRGLGRGAAENSVRLAVGFLSKFSSLADLISELPGKLDSPDPTGVQSLSDGYELMKSMYDATPTFISDPIAEMETTALMPQKDGQPVPEELLLFFRRGLATMTSLEALCKEYVDLPLCFEDLNQPSCDNIGEPLRATLYALVHLDWDEMDIKEQIRCYPYDDNLKLASVKVVRSSVLPKVPRGCTTFKQVCSLPLDTRKGIILHCLQVPASTTAAIQGLPPSCHLLAMITRYWYHNSEPKPRPLELRALILCLLTHRDTRHTAQRFNARTTHICVQWQVVFKHIHDLNSLLSQPFAPLPPVSELLDGQLLLSLVQDMPLNSEDDMLRIYKVNGDLFHRLVSLASDEASIGPKKRQIHDDQQRISKNASKQYFVPHHQATKTASSAPLGQTHHGHHETAQRSRVKKQSPKATALPTHSKRPTNASSRTFQTQRKQVQAQPPPSVAVTNRFCLLTMDDGNTSSSESD